ncbi:MAG: phosphate acyltransferase PlsX [Clostridiales bacterium]|nr:phosphate acyltransferase PlsX [Clostridiales bacterium]
MKIIVDAMGGDNAPLEIIKGVALAVKEYGQQAVLVGKESVIRKLAEENNISLDNIEIVNADDELTMEDSPGSILKEKNDSSMAIGLKMLANGEGDAFMSAGNSGAVVVGGSLIVKRLKPVKRPAFAPVMPKDKGVFMLIDSGANVDCRPEMLLQFAHMGSVYMSEVMGIENPRIGLANIGTEDHKGGELQHEAFAMLKESNLNFIGNIEARDIPFDACDVVVCDGFTGNIILKMYEGVAMAMMKKIKGMFTKSLKTKLAASMLLKDIGELKKALDYNEFGGAPLLGCSKPVFKVHGSAKAKTVKNAFRLTMQYAECGAVEKMKKSMTE